MTDTRDSHYKIISLDGGATILNALRALELIEEEVLETRGESVIARADMFSGTSAGGVSALYLASRDWERMEREHGPKSGLIAIRGCLRLLEAIFAGMPKNTRVVRTLLGMGPMYDFEFLRELMAGMGGFGELCLGDVVQRRVVIPSYRVRHRLWPEFPKPAPDGKENITPTLVVYHNAASDENPYLGERLTDVALRSGAFPLIFPVWDGEVDGGVYANNPAVIAAMWKDITGTGPSSPRTEEGMAERLRGLSDVVVLSGGSRPVAYGDEAVQDELHGWKSLSWGVTDWVLRRGRIMGFGDVIVSSNTDYANSQAIYLLGNRYIRFAPNTTYGLIDYYINVFTGRPGRVVRDAPEVAMQWFYSDSGQVDSCSANDVLNHLANYGWISPAA